MLQDYLRSPDPSVDGTHRNGSSSKPSGAETTNTVARTPEKQISTVIEPGADPVHELTKLEMVHVEESDVDLVGGVVAHSNVPTASIILPAYNEVEALPEVLKSLFEVLDETDDTYEVIVVDDGSTDDTAALAQRFPCQLITHKKNQGKGAAVRTGLTAAKGEYVIVMDADNTYPAEAIPEMVKLLAECDFVRGIRHLGATNIPIINRVGNRVFDSLLQLMYGLDGGDHLSGLYGLRREAFQAMHFVADGFDLEVEIGIKARAHQLRARRLTITYRERLGEKKLRPLQDGWRILQRMLSLALVYNPARIFIAPGLCLWALAAIFTIVLAGGPAITPQIGFSLHSFIVAALGLPAGFQLIVFGVVAALYALERNVPPKPWLLMLNRARVRFWAGMLGALLFAVGLGLLLFEVTTGIASRANNQDQMLTLVLAPVLLVWGLQAMLAVLFVSIFSGRIEKLAAGQEKKRYGFLAFARSLRKAEE